MPRDSRTDIDFNDSNEYIYIHINRRMSRIKSFYQEGISRLFSLLLVGPRGFSQLVFVRNFIDGGRRKIEISTRGEENTPTKRRPIDSTLRFRKGSRQSHITHALFSHLFHDRIYSIIDDHTQPFWMGLERFIERATRPLRDNPIF